MSAKYFGLRYMDSSKLEDYVKVLSHIMLAYARMYLMLTMISEEEISQVYRILGSLKSNLNRLANTNVSLPSLPFIYLVYC